ASLSAAFALSTSPFLNATFWFASNSDARMSYSRLMLWDRLSFVECLGERLARLQVQTLAALGALELDRAVDVAKRAKVRAAFRALGLRDAPQQPSSSAS